MPTENVTQSYPPEFLLSVHAAMRRMRFHVHPYTRDVPMLPLMLIHGHDLHEIPSTAAMCDRAYRTGGLKLTPLTNS